MKFHFSVATVILALLLVSFFAACTGGDDGSAGSSIDDTADNDDDDTGYHAVVNEPDDDESDDDEADDTEENYPFPPNIDLYGVIGRIVSDNPLCGQDASGVMRYNHESWIISEWVDISVYDIWGSSPDDLYAVGINAVSCFDPRFYRPEQRFFAHYNGNQWTSITLPGQFVYFMDVYGTSSTDVYIVEYPHTIYHYDGNTWSIDKIGPSGSDLKSIWASPSGLAIAVGYSDSNIRSGSLFLTKENGVWNKQQKVGMGMVTVWGAPDDVVFAAGGNMVYRYMGGEWEKMDVPELGNTNITKLAGVSSTDVYAIGEVLNTNNSIFVLAHYDGNSWVEVEIPEDDSDYYGEEYLGGLWVAGSDSVFVSLNHFYIGRTLYFDGYSWHTLSSGTGPMALWGFVVP